MPLMRYRLVLGTRLAMAMTMAIAVAVVPRAAAQQQPIPVQPGAAGFDTAATESAPYLDILARYRQGDGPHEKAIEELAALPDGHSQGVVFKEFERIAFRLGVHERAATVTRQRREMLADAWADALPAAAVMHLEAGYLLLEVDNTGRAMAHLSTARAIVDSTSWAFVIRIRPEMEERLASIRREIYIGILWSLQTYRLFDQLVPHLERTRDQFRDDPMVRLALGSFEEVKATTVEMSRQAPPSTHMMIPVNTWRKQTRQTRWEKAIEHYRAALKADPTLDEARLRLGRVLRLRGKVKEAREELAAVVASTSAAMPPPPTSGPRMVVPYLGAMFLAEVLEEDGAAAEALTMYQDIARRWPDCQSGVIALSRAHEARGERQAALKALQSLYREQPKRACIDPWWTYNLGQGWRFGPFLADLYSRVKGRS